MADNPGKVDFELVAPEALLASRAVGMVVVPGSEGDFGVLPRHAPLISMVRPGVIRIYEDGKLTDRIFVAGGFAEVTKQRCTVLAEHAVPVDEINRADVEERIKLAHEAIEDAANEAERTQAERRLKGAEAMLKYAP